MRRLGSPLPTWLLAGTAALPVLVWWLGWAPGFASSDTIDQFGQVASGLYVDHHPAIHTLYLSVFSLGGTQPELVTLFQVLALGGLLAYAAHRLTGAGVPLWLAVGAAWLLGLSPAVAPTTIALWKDVPFALFLLWGWIELLSLATDPTRAPGWWPAIRLGVALSGIWLLRANGPLTVLGMLVVLFFVYRRRLRLPAAVTATSAVLVILISGPLYAALGVQGSGITTAEVFLPDVAASYVSEPETFTDGDEDLLEAVAPLEVWTGRYTCFESTPLLFDPAFDAGVVRASADDYLSLEIRVLFRDPDSVIEHRACAASFLVVPAQPDDAYFHRPPYEIPPNTVGLERDPFSERARSVTDAVFRWAERDAVLWLTWRPAIVILPTLAAILVFALRPTGRRFLLPSALFLAHLANVAATSPSQEFRYAYPLYLIGVLTLTLLWPVLAPVRAGRHERVTAGV